MYAEFNYLAGLIGFLTIIVIIYGPWQSLMTDWTRQNLFEIRDEIFDLAADGRFPFDDENYRIIRESIQSAIRFAHEYTWPRIFVYALILSNSETEKSSRLQEAVQAIEDENLRERLRSFKQDIALNCLTLMVVRSPALLLLSFILIPAAFILMRAESRRLSQFADRAQREAEIVAAIAA